MDSDPKNKVTHIVLSNLVFITMILAVNQSQILDQQHLLQDLTVDRKVLGSIRLDFLTLTPVSTANSNNSDWAEDYELKLFHVTPGS
eukprot:scaffold54995_cov70-Cyclotella_meneghiniana.AAC.2